VSRGSSLLRTETMVK